MKDRLTVVSMIYHQQGDQEATLEEIRYVRTLKTEDEQPYQRTSLKVGTEWKPLIPKGCWVEKPGMILVQNHEGEWFPVTPTPEELAEVMNRTLEIGETVYPVNTWLIPPKEAFHGYPSSSSDLYIRCKAGEARYSITVFPE